MAEGNNTPRFTSGQGFKKTYESSSEDECQLVGEYTTAMRADTGKSTIYPTVTIPRPSSNWFRGGGQPIVNIESNILHVPGESGRDIGTRGRTRTKPKAINIVNRSREKSSSSCYSTRGRITKPTQRRVDGIPKRLWEEASEDIQRHDPKQWRQIFQDGVSPHFQPEMGRCQTGLPEDQTYQSASDRTHQPSQSNVGSGNEIVTEHQDLW